MTPFSELIQSAVIAKHGKLPTEDAKDFSLPGRLQRNAAERFPMLATRHGFRLWQKATPKKMSDLRIVVGVNTASRSDMVFLDQLQEYLPLIKKASGTVEVFNCYYFQTVEEFQERLPDITQVYQTPVISVWQQGKFVFSESGAKAREKLLNFVKDVEVVPQKKPESTNDSK